MNLFNKLLGSFRSAAGWENLIWRRLPLSGVNHALVPAVPEAGFGTGALLLWDYKTFGVVAALDAHAYSGPGVPHRQGDEEACVRGWRLPISR